MNDFNTKSWGYIWLDFITKTRKWTQTDKMPVGYEDDDHLLRLMQAISLNARIALDMMQGITAK